MPRPVNQALRPSGTYQRSWSPKRLYSRSTDPAQSITPAHIPNFAGVLVACTTSLMLLRWSGLLSCAASPQCRKKHCPACIESALCWPAASKVSDCSSAPTPHAVLCRAVLYCGRGLTCVQVVIVVVADAHKVKLGEGCVLRDQRRLNSPAAHTRHIWGLINQALL